MEKKTIIGVTTAAVAGATLGVLFAPKKGKETREDIKKGYKKIKSRVENFGPDDVKKQIEKQMKAIKRSIREIEMERKVEIAKKKADQIRKSCDDMIQTAKEEGNEKLENMVQDFKEQTVSVLKDVVKKLEK